MNWVHAISKLSNDNQGFVLVTVLDIHGSAPREIGSKMVVTAEHCFDTIGGGNLEYEAIGRARTLLERGEQTVFSQSFSLGKDLSQCCGGDVKLLFECRPASRVQIVLFGAGHVGSCLAKILADLPYQVAWLDTREAFVDKQRNQDFPPHLQIESFAQPETVVQRFPRHSIFLIVTHSHELDMQLVEAVISRGDARFCGLIGSKSKAAKFRNRLRRKGFTDVELDMLVCPVGLPDVGGKKPMEVAVSIAAQVIGLAHETELRLSADLVSSESA